MPPLQPERPKPELRPEPLPADASPSYDRGATPRPGAFYSAPPSMQPPRESSGAPPAASQSTAPRRLAAVGVIAAALALGAWYGMSTPDAPPSGPPIAAATSNEKTWHVAAADVDQAATDQLKALLSGSRAAAGAANDLKAANAPALTELANAAPEMAAEIESGQRRLYRVYLLDFAAQDGDFAELQVDGISFGDIDLSNAGTSILLPVAPGKPMDMKLIAKADGGGGVTVAFISSAGEARTSILQVGQIDQWQVVVQ